MVEVKTQAELCARVPLSGGELKPTDSFSIILRHALP